MKAELSAMLNVKDVARSVAFYRKLGFAVRWKGAGADGKLDYAGLVLGQAVLTLGRIPKDRRRGSDPGYAKWVSTPLGAGVVISVALRSVEKVYARAKRAKAWIESPLMKMPYGTAFMIIDPDGYVVQFLRPSGTNA